MLQINQPSCSVGAGFKELGYYGRSLCCACSAIVVPSPHCLSACCILVYKSASFPYVALSILVLTNDNVESYIDYCIAT